MPLSFDEIVVRPCGLGDVSTLALVGAATFLEAYAGMLEGEAILAHCRENHSEAAYRRYMAEPDCRTWIAEAAKGSAPVGYVMLTRPELPLGDLAEDDVELKRIYLFSRLHGGGRGQRLIDQAIVGAREQGARRLLLGVHRENARALAFYRRNGFVQVGVRTFRLGRSVYDDLVLGRVLQAG